MILVLSHQISNPKCVKPLKYLGSKKHQIILQTKIYLIKNTKSLFILDLNTEEQQQFSSIYSVHTTCLVNKFPQFYHGYQIWRTIMFKTFSGVTSFQIFN